MNPLIVFLSHRDRLSRDEIQARIHARLTKEGGCRNVRYAPSRLRRRYVCADVTPTVFLEDAYPAEEARLEIRFWKPTTASHEYYWINWIEPSREFLVGWHQDETHDDLGQCHLQIEHRNETLTREPASSSMNIHFRFLNSASHNSPRRFPPFGGTKNYPLLTT